MAEPSESIIFVVDGKRLEAMSLVLATTIAAHHDTGSEVRLIAYVSAVTRPDLDQATLALYEACGVEIAPLPDSTGIWKKPYPHGNKLLACAAPRTSARTTFLDTDMAVMAKITGLPEADPFEIFAVPEGKPTWGKKGGWEQAYAFFGLPMPEERVTLMRGRKKEYFPYFNAGFVSFSDMPLEDDGRSFGAMWLEFARQFDWHCAVADKRPWLDQITLPLVMAEFGLSCLLLPEFYNYSISEREDLSEVGLAKVIHYHRTGYFNKLPNRCLILDQVRSRVPARLHAKLDTMLEFYRKTS